jgi:hypothetical protein
MKKKKRRAKRQLPVTLRPLAALCLLANLVDDDQVRAVQHAEAHMLQAFGGAAKPAENTAAAQTTKAVFQTLEAEVAKHPKALAELQTLTGWEFLKHSPDHNLFHTIADTRAVLREAAMLRVEGDMARLPESSPATLGVVNDGIRLEIRLVTRPAWMWMLFPRQPEHDSRALSRARGSDKPRLLDGLEVGRLRICERCERLCVPVRKDQLGCSPACGDVLYARRYRNPDYRRKNKPGSKLRSIRETLNRLKRKG